MWFHSCCAAVAAVLLLAVRYRLRGVAVK